MQDEARRREPRLLLRRAEAFVLDVIVTPLALSLCIGLPLTVVFNFGPFTDHVIVAPAVFVFVWAIVTESALGRSGGKGAVDLRIIRQTGSSPHAILLRAGIKWTPLIFVASLMLWGDRLSFTRGSTIASAAPWLVLAIWVAMLGVNAVQDRGWLDRRCRTRVVDSSLIENSERGFEVKFDASPQPAMHVSPRKQSSQAATFASLFASSVFAVPSDHPFHSPVNTSVAGPVM